MSDLPAAAARPIFMDGHSTTPVDPRVVEAMLPHGLLDLHRLEAALGPDTLLVAVSAGAACSSSAFGHPSPVLLALGLDAARARASLRFGLTRYNTEAEVDDAIEHVVSVVTRLRAGSAFDELATGIGDHEWALAAEGGSDG